MRRHFHWDKKYLYWGITAFLVVAAAIVFYMALRYLPDIGQLISKIVSILSPFVWGLVLSYLLAPLMRSLEKHAFHPLAERIYKNNNPRASARLGRGLAVVISELVLLIIITALIALILPQLYSSIEMIVQNSPIYIANLTNWVSNLLQDFPQIREYITDTLSTVNTDLVGWISNTLLPGIGSLLSNVTTGVRYVVGGVYNLIIGIIVSIYILGNLEHYGASVRRTLYSLFSIETAEKIREGVAFTDRTFMGFINGKLLDSAIVGLICYIVCAILQMPYALLVSVIVGVTNIIPFFGPFIGAVPSAIIILMVDPLKALIFVIFIIILQQIDGNIIGPKILGNSTGINGFWVMFSIIVGAGLFGFWGMLLGVPVFVLIYTVINGKIKKKLEHSSLPNAVAAYEQLDHIDPVTRELIYRLPPDAEAEDASEEE